MSGPRASARVQENERRLQEEAERAEKEALDRVSASLNSFFECLNGATFSLQEMKLPDEWITEPEPSLKRMRVEEVDDDSSIAPKLRVAKFQGPPYRKLRQNLYRPPLQRTLIPAEDCPSCSCKPATGCGLDCHNRSVYM